MMGTGSPMRACGRAGLACLAVSLAFSAPAYPAEATAVSATSTPFISLLQVLLGLGIVLAVIAGTAWLLKRLGPGQTSPAGAMRVVGGVAIGPKERVVLVDVGDTRLVLGVAPGHVSTLHQMPRPADEPASPEIAPLANLFEDKLQGLLRRKGGGKNVV